MHQSDVVLPASKHKIVRNTPKWLKVVFRGYALLIIVCISFMYLVALSALAAQLDEPTLLRSFVVGLITFVFYTITFFISLLFAFGFYKQRSFIIWPSIILGFDASLVLYQTLAWYRPMITDVILYVVIFASFIYITLAIIVVLNRHYFVPQRMGVPFSVILSLAFIPPIIIALSSLTVQDLPAVNDANLVVTERFEEIPQHENAYYILPDLNSFPTEKRRQIVHALDVHQQYINGGEVDDVDLYRTVEETRFVSDAFLVAAKKKGYQCPEALNVYAYDEKLCSLSELREYAHVTELRVYAELRNENYEEALRIIEALVNFGHMLEETEPAPLVQYLVSSSVSLIAYQASHELLDALENTEGEEVEVIRTDLLNTLKLNVPNKNENLVDSLRYTYTDTKNSLGGELSSAKTNYLWHPNRTMQTFADVWLLTVRFTETPCGEGEELRQNLTEKINAQKKDASSFTRLLFRPNVIGNNIASMILTPLTPVKDRACKLESDYTLLLKRLEE